MGLNITLQGVGLGIKIKPADLFFTRANGIVSAVIRQRTWGQYSHVQVITQAAEADGKRIIDVISADAEGVICRAVRPEEWERYAILTCGIMSAKERQDVVQFCFSKIGAGYDFLGLADFLLNADVQEEDRYFCSELAFMAYQAAGIQLQERVSHAFISPRDLYISPLLRVIEEKTE